MLAKATELLHWLEIILAVTSVVVVIVGFYFYSKELGHFVTADNPDIHHIIEELLSDILLLVVGIELAVMLIKKTPESLVEIMFFVVARKVLIKNEETMDLLIGVAALAGLFAIKKYLAMKPKATDNKGEEADPDVFE